MTYIDENVELEIHRRQLYIAGEIFSLCERENIKCFLVGGSLLGAVKQNGILSGDKDIDIGMLRTDYERFLSLSGKLPKDLAVLDPERCNQYNWLFAKVYQQNTRLTSTHATPFDYDVGIYVDIIPYDYVDQGNQRQEYYSSKLKKWLLLSKCTGSYKNKKGLALWLPGHICSRKKLVQSFSERSTRKDIAQNLVGGAEDDWFEVSELEQLKQANFSGVRVMLPKWDRYLDKNYPGWTSKDVSRNELSDYVVDFDLDAEKIDLHQLHKVQLELAMEVKRICQKNNIPFFLVDGTALGAKNLGGFLPWDDDLDIGMFWPDYLRFLKVCNSELNARFKMKDFTIDEKFGCTFGQMICTDYCLVQDNNRTALDEKGIFIDIHPFSECSDIKICRVLDYYRFKFYKLCLLERRGYMSEESKAFKIFHYLNRIIPESTIKKRLLFFRNNRTGTRAIKLHGRHPEDYIYINNISRLETIQFEGETFLIQPDATRMLDAIYGKFDLGKKEINRHKIISIKEVE